MKITVEALRANAGLNQEDVAKRLGMCRATYISKEKDPDTFKWRDIKKIRDIVKDETGEKVSLDYIK